MKTDKTYIAFTVVDISFIQVACFDHAVNHFCGIYLFVKFLSASWNTVLSTLIFRSNLTAFETGRSF